VSVDPTEVQKHLEGVEYPATKDEVISVADANDAPDDVIEMLQSMHGEQYDGPEEVMEALGHA
jgi:Protein of unknown function (DUF2795)